MKRSMVMVGLLVFAVAILAGCGKSEDTNAPRQPGPATNAPTEAVVNLTDGQTNAVKVGPVGTYLFPVEEEGVGSVNFAEDPAIVQAESTLVGAAATFDSTGKELARVTALGESNGIAPKEIEQATADHQTAEASLKAAREAVRALGVADGTIDQTVSDVRIQAPPEGQHWVTANISENNSPLLRTGQVVRVRVKAFPDHVFEGKVSRIYAIVDPNIHRQLIRCTVEDPNDELRPGMLADVVVRVKDPVEATAIPAEGVVRESDGTMTAWVTTDGHKFFQRKIKIGLQTDGRDQVLDGLKTGEMAVTEGAVFLSNILNAPPSDD